MNCLDLNQLSLFFGKSSKLCHCHHFCQITQSINWLRDLESFDVVRVSGMTRTYEFNANMLYTCSHRNGLFNLISGHPMSRVHVLEEYPVRNSSLKNLNHWLRNSSLKNVNTWGVPASEIWTPVEFDTQKPQLWIILAWKTLPRSLRNSSIKNLNPWGIPASKPWTCEELQTQILTLVDFQLQKYWYFRNSSLNC